MQIGLRAVTFSMLAALALGGTASEAASHQAASEAAIQVIALRGDAGGKRFDGIGVADGGGATSVLLKDYPAPQRSQILDMVFKPKFGASVSTLLVEVPGDGNSTEGSMSTHMRTRGDLNYGRGYIWWILQEAKRRNPQLSLDANVWSAPRWIGNGQFWSQDAADYDVKWLQGLRKVYGLELDAIGCRNEKQVSYDFAEKLRATLDSNGFGKVKIHAFDNWEDDRFDFASDLLTDEKLRNSVDILSGHILLTLPTNKAEEAKEIAARLNKPIWNTEEHVFKSGFDDEISIVQAFNHNFIDIGATKIVVWYDIAALYPIEAQSENGAMLLARAPWSGNYKVREALWGYAHYGQFSELGWQYLNGGSGALAGGGSFVTLKSPGTDYSIILETKDAKAPQQLRFQVGGGLSPKSLCVWRSNTQEQFIRQADIRPVDGTLTLTLEPDSIYSLSTTTGQRKGSFDGIPSLQPFPLPYYETFDEYSAPGEWGYLPHYTADISGVFEIADRPDKKGKSLRQVVPLRPLAWAPEWLPYTILGDDQWGDYEVSSDVYLNPGDSAGVMGRLTEVGTGYGTIPKGYFFEVSDEGKCRLVVISGKKDEAKPFDGGEKTLGSAQLANIGPNQWHTLKLQFAGSTITGLVDDNPVLSATDTLYVRGMAGLLAGSHEQKLSTPYFDNVLIKKTSDPMPNPTSILPALSPIYIGLEQKH